MKAKEIMTKEVITVNQQASIEEIARKLIDNNLSGLPVTDDDGKMVGIVTEGDLLRKDTPPRFPNFVNILGAIIYYSGVNRYNDDWKKLLATKAAEIMTSKVITVAEDAEVETIAQLMLNHGIKRVPVVRDGQLLGVVSRADIIKTLL